MEAWKRMEALDSIDQSCVQWNHVSSNVASRITAPKISKIGEVRSLDRQDLKFVSLKEEP